MSTATMARLGVAASPDTLAHAEVALLNPAHRLTPDQLDAAAQALAADPAHLHMARMLAAKASSQTGIPLDDAEGAALLGLCDAARRFRPEQGIKFTSYAPRRIVGAIADMARSWRPGKQRRVDVAFVNLDTPLGEGQRRPLVVGDVLAVDGESPEAAVDVADGLDSLLKCLPAQHRAVMRLLLFEAATTTMKRAGERCGVSESRVCQIHSEAVDLIRASLAARGITRPADLL